MKPLILCIALTFSEAPVTEGKPPIVLQLVSCRQQQSDSFGFCLFPMMSRQVTLQVATTAEFFCQTEDEVVSRLSVSKEGPVVVMVSSERSLDDRTGMSRRPRLSSVRRIEKRLRKVRSDIEFKLDGY